jgi:uncharacterized phiE125 gp8 family phage protein
MLTETTEPVFGQDVIDELARHLKISVSAGSDVEAEILGALRAAVAYVEGQTAVALVERIFTWRAFLGPKANVAIPVGPVSALNSVGRVLSDNSVETVDLAFFRLEQKPQRSFLSCSAKISDLLEFQFTAGFGPAWSNAPATLRMAIFMLAAHYFDNRHAVGGAGVPVPLGVGALIAAWRPVRLGMAQ